MIHIKNNAMMKLMFKSILLVCFFAINLAYAEIPSTSGAEATLGSAAKATVRGGEKAREENQVAEQAVQIKPEIEDQAASESVSKEAKTDERARVEAEAKAIAKAETKAEAESEAMAEGRASLALERRVEK